MKRHQQQFSLWLSKTQNITTEKKGEALIIQETISRNELFELKLQNILPLLSDHQN